MFIYIFDLLENLFIAYLKEEQKLNLENKNLLSKIINIDEFLSSIIKDYKNTSFNIISQIENKKALEFLDEQVRKEKKEFKRNIINKNKTDKNDLLNIIETLLSHNFYYLSQKYVIYRVIVDAFEQISEIVESLVNQIIKNLLDEKNSFDLLKEIYFKKYEDFKGRIDNFLKKNKIYKTN